jgi:hypothetical protein
MTVAIILSHNSGRMNARKGLCGQYNNFKQRAYLNVIGQNFLFTEYPENL